MFYNMFFNVRKVIVQIIRRKGGDTSTIYLYICIS